ncbi:MAG: hypothetical protein Ta2A_18940 [Treponemataceae bacterium]|nr:MAG: hypothetical protein Ta2A_18940 [Treponemataceae bacterium]
MKRTIKVILFAMLFVGIYWCVNNVLRYKHGIEEINKFYNLKKDSLDVLFFGTSFAQYHIDPTVIWKEKGIASYNLGSPNQPIGCSYYRIRKSLEQQSPKVIVLETLVSAENSMRVDASSFIATYGFSPSKDEIKAIFPNNEIDYFLGLPFYHSRRSLRKADFIAPKPDNDKPYLNGFAPQITVAPVVPIVSDITDMAPITEGRFQYLFKIIDFTKEHNIPLLLIASPTILNDERQMVSNTIQKIASDNDIRFINYNLLYDELDLDFQMDFADNTFGHLNVSGAVKVSKHIANILATEYGIEDKRQNPAYSEWNTWAERVASENEESQ